MSQNRKLKANIENTLKKIDELVVEFNEIWDRVYTADNQAQKEKYESDLKKQIKKLQRQRDSLKTWTQSSDSTIAQYGDRLANAKREIEDLMTKFRECEKETKTKAFSKEGLRQPSRQTPQDEKREEMQNEFRRQISELKKEVEDCECEEKREKSRKRNANQDTIQKLEMYIKNHHEHITNLELVLRQLDNHIINPYDVDPILSAIDDYLISYKDSDYIFDDSIYDDFDLSTAPSKSDTDSDLSESEEETASQPSTEKPAATIPSALLSPVIVDTPSPSPSSSKQVTPVNSVWKKPLSKPVAPAKPMNYSEIIQKGQRPAPSQPAAPLQRASSSSSSTFSKPSNPLLNPSLTPPLSQAMSPSAKSGLSANASLMSEVVEEKESDVLRSLRQASEFALASSRCGFSYFNEFEQKQFHNSLKLFHETPLEIVAYEPYYQPLSTVEVPEGFPRVPGEPFSYEPRSGMPLDIAIFVFAMEQNTYIQYAAARTLYQNGWFFDWVNRKWYCPISPVRSTEKGDVCDMKVFDYKTWKRSEESGVLISSLHLEDEVLPCCVC